MRNRLLTSLGVFGAIWLGPFLLLEILAGDQNGEAKNQEGLTEFTLEHLTQSLSLKSIHQVQFDENYYSHLLTAPIQKSGTLSYEAPSRFEKHIATPMEESFIVDGDTIQYENRTQGVTQTLSLQDYPPLQILIEGLRSIFSGDLRTLQRYYDTELNGTREQWVLTIIPFEEEIQESVESIQFRGRGDQITEIEVRESNGDHSSLRLKEC